MNTLEPYLLHPIGIVRSRLQSREDSPRQGFEGAPDAWIEIYQPYLGAVEGIDLEAELIILTWFHLAKRDALQVHPRRNTDAPVSGVFSTRSPDRPNPIGLHKVRVLEIDNKHGIRVYPLEALDGTPVIDIKPVLAGIRDE